MYIYIYIYMAYTYSCPSHRIAMPDIELLDVDESMTGSVICQLRPKFGCNSGLDIAVPGVEDCPQGFCYTLSPIRVLDFVYSSGQPLGLPKLRIDIRMPDSRPGKPPCLDTPKVLPVLEPAGRRYM